MPEENTTDTVPDEAVHQQHGAITAAANNASDFEVHTDNSILADNSEEAQMDTQAQADNEAEVEHDDLASCYSHSSCYPESYVDDEDAVQSFRQKLLALATELHVKFENIGYVRESDCIRAFPMTLRNPPPGASWPDGTRAVLRMNGELALNNRRSRGVQIEDQAILSPNSTREADAPTLNSLHHVYFFVRPADGGNVDVPSLQELPTGPGEEQHVHQPQSPVSATSDATNNSTFSGETLTSGPPIRTDEDNDGDSADYDNDSAWYVSNSNYYGEDEPQRRDQWERLDEALLSNLLQEHGVPAPQTLAFDVSWQNALKRPYAIQASLLGDQLSKVYRERKGMSLEDRLWLAGETAELRATLEKIEFQGIGKLHVNADPDLTPGRLPLNMSVRADIDRKLDTFGFPLDTARAYGGRFGPRAPLYYSLYDTMLRLVDDLFSKVMLRRRIDREPFFRAYVAFKDMLLDMDHLGWFAKADKALSKSVLNLGYINDKQILVQRTVDTSEPWRLTGVIGFDDAEVVPAVLSKCAWSWVWDVHDASEVLPRCDQFGWTRDFEELPIDLPYLTEDDLKVKQRHEDVLIEKLYVPKYGDKAREQYFDDTYGRGRWLRRLFDFAKEEVIYAASKYRFNKLVADWEEYKKNQNIQPRPLDVWKRVPDYIRGKEVEKPGPVQPPVPVSSGVENQSSAVPSSSLEHVYFFVNQQAFSSGGPAAI